MTVLRNVGLSSGRETSFSSDKGRLEVRVLDPSLLVTKMTGCLDLALAKSFMGALDDWIALGGLELHAFHDWASLEDYDSDARVALTPWSKVNLERFSEVHLLVHGRALAFGIRIVNGIIGGLMTIHHDRDAFERALSVLDRRRRDSERSEAR